MIIEVIVCTHTSIDIKILHGPNIVVHCFELIVKVQID